MKCFLLMTSTACNTVCQFTLQPPTTDSQGHSSHLHTYSAFSPLRLLERQLIYKSKLSHGVVMEVLKFPILFSVPSLLSAVCVGVCLHNPHSPHSSWRWLRESLSPVYSNQASQRLSVSVNFMPFCSSSKLPFHRDSQGSSSTLHRGLIFSGFSHSFWQAFTQSQRQSIQHRWG